MKKLVSFMFYWWLRSTPASKPIHSFKIKGLDSCVAANHMGNQYYGEPTAAGLYIIISSGQLLIYSSIMVI